MYFIDNFIKNIIGANPTQLYLAKYPNGIYFKTEFTSHTILEFDISHFQSMIDKLGEVIENLTYIKELSIITLINGDQVDLSSFTGLPTSLKKLTLTNYNIDLNKVSNNIETLELMYYNGWELNIPKKIRRLVVSDILYIYDYKNIIDMCRFLRDNSIDLEINKVLDLDIVRRSVNIVGCNLDSSEREVLEYIGAYKNKEIVMNIYNKF
jgi:hypothetical protein